MSNKRKESSQGEIVAKQLNDPDVDFLVEAKSQKVVPRVGVSNSSLCEERYQCFGLFCCDCYVDSRDEELQPREVINEVTAIWQAHERSDNNVVSSDNIVIKTKYSDVKPLSKDAMYVLLVLKDAKEYVTLASLSHIVSDHLTLTRVITVLTELLVQHLILRVQSMTADSEILLMYKFRGFPL